jgi:flagellar motor component MotA
MYTLFVEGGVEFMTILTLILIALFLAAWKAPAWVKEIGMMAPVIGIISSLMGLIAAGRVIENAGSMAQGVIWGGIRVVLIPAVYGLLIYLISLIIRIIQKPRI